MDLDSMSYETLVAIMNAINPSPFDFKCEADKEAFTEVSVRVARKWQERQQD